MTTTQAVQTSLTSLQKWKCARGGIVVLYKNGTDSLHVSVFVRKRIFFPSSLAYHSHLSSENGHRKRIFSKGLFRVEISEYAGFLFTCRRAKTEFFEYDDVIHHTLLAWRMLIKECYRISIVLAFSYGRAKTIRIRNMSMRIFFWKRRKNIRFQKYLDAYARG